MMMTSRPADAITIRWTADSNGRITFFNRDWMRYTGVSDAEVCGSADAWIACVHPDDQQLVRAMWSARSIEADSYVVQFRLLGQDGVFRSFQGVAVPVKQGTSVSSWAGYCEPVPQA
jgi:PAS domain S-box-containing protein